MRPKVLVIDDDVEVLKIFKRYLENENYTIDIIDNSLKALETVGKVKPDLILLDVRMPEMDGYEVCSKIKEDKNLTGIPVIFISALDEEQDKKKAFSYGAVDYIVKPPSKKEILDKIRKHLKNLTAMQEREEIVGLKEVRFPGQFKEFKKVLENKLNLNAEQKKILLTTKVAVINSLVEVLNISSAQLSQYIAEFLKLKYMPYLDPELLQTNILPNSFCRKYHVVAISDLIQTKNAENKVFALSNPFNWELIEFLSKVSGNNRIVITEPENIDSFFQEKGSNDKITVDIISQTASQKEIENHPVKYITNHIICKAISQRASDIHIEPKEVETSIRFRVDGDMQQAFFLKDKTALRMIARFKVLADLDIAERRKPQDGSFAISVDNRNFRLRVATTNTAYGESVILRLLEPKAKPKALDLLGMTPQQEKTMREFSRQSSGLILLVGPTGSGKTTTIYSLLSQIDCKSRSLISVEDPIEYTIPDANQQQVNEKIGVTFNILLRSAMRQDPDILYIGEMRDQFSSSVAMQAAGTGHLAISTMHSANATTAVFRLETLEVSRTTMADSILGIIAQKLLKVLCPHCREVFPITKEERRLLSKYTTDFPEKVAHPAGCPQCNYSGFYGREAVYEILKFDSEISKMVRDNVPVAGIRSFAKQRGDYLIGDHALQKVKDLKFSVKQVCGTILIEEVQINALDKKTIRSVSEEKPEKELVESKIAEEKKSTEKRHILLVEDDSDIRRLVASLLENGGYSVTVAEDGIEALLRMGKVNFELILSDVDMPNLDGFKLLEMKNQKGIKSPVVFLTSRANTEDEKRGLKMGATDYIKKPFDKETLLLKINRIFEILTTSAK
ncbi:Flp pilus assembly complex ATPase component TadA [bacterium]|nr:Flp pilus assembly complex ATPase component TadA [bacterium]